MMNQPSKWKSLLVATGLCSTILGGVGGVGWAAPLRMAQSETARTPQTAMGRLDQNSAQLDNGRYYAIHTFEGTFGEVLIIEFTSEDFDTFLGLGGPDGELFARDDNGAGGTNSQILVTLPSTGTYTLFATSFAAGETGQYQLEWQTATATDQELARANQLNQQAIGLYGAGRYREAISLAEQVLAIRESQLGSEHPNTAVSLNNLAALYERMGRYEEAEPLLQRALIIHETQLGPNHLNTAASLISLATLYVSMGRYGEAEPLLQRALTIHETQQLAPNHLNTALILNNLATLYVSMGRYREAEPLLQRALTIHETQLGSNHSNTATSLNNLARLYVSMGLYGEAEPLFQRALIINETELHPNTAVSLHNLAALYETMGRYGEAESLLQRALIIHETQLGSEHPNIAVSLNNLAALYETMGRYGEAESLFQRALIIYETELGSIHIHPNTAGSLRNLAGLFWVQGQLQDTLTYLQRSLAVEETALSRNLVIGSDANKRDYLATVASTTDWAISLHLRDMPDNVEASHLALTTLFQRKGRILDFFTNLRAQLTEDSEVVALFDDLSAINAQLSSLTTNPPPNLSAEDYQVQLTDLQEQFNTREAELSRRSAQFANLTTSPTVEEIQAALPRGSALVEFIRYRPFNSTAFRSEQFGPDRYAAYILATDGTIQGMDLGHAEAIDAAVEAFSTSLASSDTPIGQVKAEARNLDELLMAPVRAALGDTTTVFLSPDGALSLIPFEALVDASGNYLVETYQFRYLTSGRDLMRLDGTVLENNPALLVGNPTYGRPGELMAQANTRAIDFENRIFPALPGTQVEVDLIAPKLSGAQVYTQTNATEALIKQQAQPGILHIATHGFFEPTEEALNPLLQSGLILAGAAAGGQSGPDQNGILTALEVTGLNLSGTQLVVLSACETGLGELAAGEGIYGLRRAFVLAGSQTQVISLWKVSDTATQELMVDYYDRLLSGTPRDAALRETQRAFLSSDDYSHPYYWAAFIGSGDWRPLQLAP